jgi:hypothetical protein
MQSPFEFSFAHFRTPRNVSTFRLRIQLCAGRLPLILSPAPLGPPYRIDPGLAHDHAGEEYACSMTSTPTRQASAIE